MQKQSSTLNFKGQNIFVGIDVHLESWSVSIFTEHFEHKTFQQPPEEKALVDYLKRNFPGANYYTVYEAGFCGFRLHNSLTEMEVKNIVVNPADVPTSQKENVFKRDPVDSRKLGRSLRAGALTGIFVPDPESLKYRALIRHRATMVKDMTRFKQRVKSYLYFNGIKIPQEFKKQGSYFSKRYLKWLKEEAFPGLGPDSQTIQYMVQEVEAQRLILLKILKDVRAMSINERFNESVILLRSIPGIGIITAMTFLTEIVDINRFSDVDHLAGYLGLVPSCHSSGQKDSKGEMTFRGNKNVREMIIESSWTAVRRDPALSMKYNELRKRMDKNKALIRIARMVLRRILFVLKNKTRYETGIV